MSPPYTVTTPRDAALEYIRLLAAIVGNYSLVAGAIKGVADPSFATNEVVASGMRDLHRAAQTALGILTRKELIESKVLFGIGLVATIPALFWSCPSAFEQAAHNLAGFYGYDEAERDYATFVQHLYNMTALVRADMVEDGAFVGWLPLRYNADLPFRLKGYSFARMVATYRKMWCHLPRNASFTCPAWGTEVLYHDNMDGYDGDSSDACIYLEESELDSTDEESSEGSFRLSSDDSALEDAEETYGDTWKRVLRNKVSRPRPYVIPRVHP